MHRTVRLAVVGAASRCCCASCAAQAAGRAAVHAGAGHRHQRRGDGAARARSVAFVTIAVETRAQTPREAQQQNADAMASVQQRLREDRAWRRDAVRTTGYSIQQEFDFANGRAYAARLRGAQRRRGSARRGRAGRRTARCDGSRPAQRRSTGVRFDLKDRAAAEREALRLAVDDARASADADCRRCRPHRRPRAAHRRTLRSRDSGAAADGDGAGHRRERGAAETPIEAGTIEIHAQVDADRGSHQVAAGGLHFGRCPRNR